MLEVEKIRQDKEGIKTRLGLKNFDDHKLVDEVLALDEERKNAQGAMDDSLAELNAISREVGILFKEGKKEEAETKKKTTSSLKDTSNKLKEEHKAAEEKLKELLIQIPNAPHPSVPEGKGEEDNEIVQEAKEIPELPEGSKSHWDLATKYDIIDFELGNKLTGAGFPVYKGKGAKLQRSLINFFLDHALEAGYLEILPPHIVNEASAFGTGQLPDKEGQMYSLKEDPYYLIPTAEVPVTNIYRDVLIPESDLPIKMTAYTPCYRREAGSYGKDVRGLNRVHQFDKVEIVQIEHPDRSYETLQKMVDHVKALLDKLELPYRVAKLCGGDISFASALTYDMEVYAAGQKRWLEVSSISNFESFQANRMNVRYQSSDKKKALVHTLNGSALALPRIVAAILENNQSPDGIKMPAALQAYTGFKVLN